MSKIGSKNDPIKIAVFGTGGVGKSAFTVQYVQHIFVEKYDPTIEDTYRKFVERDGRHLQLEILDTAGTEAFSAMRDLYMKNSHGFILLYSVVAMASFDDLEPIYKQICNIKDANEILVEDIPFILVANKCDLEDDRIIDTETGQKKANEWNCEYVETSAKTRMNINVPFEMLIDKILELLNNNTNDQKNTCCNIL